jgi:hypothetical protein
MKYSSRDFSIVIEIPDAARLDFEQIRTVSAFHGGNRDLELEDAGTISPPERDNSWSR